MLANQFEGARGSARSFPAHVELVPLVQRRAEVLPEVLGARELRVLEVRLQHLAQRTPSQQRTL